MAGINIPDVLVYLTDLAGVNYYYATKGTNGIYLFDTTTDARPLVNLPDKWSDTEIFYNRDPQYLGVFRSQSEQFSFQKDARAILLNLYYAANGNIQADCKMRIDIFDNVHNGYKTAYSSEIDFSSVDDKKFESDTVGLGGIPTNEGQFLATTLDSKLFSLMQSYGSVPYNVPYWNYGGGTSWTTDGTWVYHDGIKVLYSAAYQSSAKPTDPLVLSVQGFAKGSQVNGRHTMPSMENYNIVQNNGTTTYIGNTILQKFLIQGGQAQWLNEQLFDGDNDSRPYGRNQFCLKDILPYGAGTDPVDMSVMVNATIDAATGISFNVTSSPFFIKFVLFEIGADNLPIMSGPDYTYTEITRVNIPTTGEILPASPYHIFTQPPATPVDISLVYDKVYVLGVIVDTAIPGTGIHASQHADFNLTQLQLTFFSKYNSGAVVTPVAAPIFPPSPVLGFTPAVLFNKLVKNLATEETDAYGFPIQVATDYVGTSTFLSTSTRLFDNDPTQTLWTSEYALHLLNGQPYLSVSLYDFFNVCKNIWGCGLAIKGNEIQIERMQTFFDGATEIMALGSNVASLEIKPFTELMHAYLTAGYPSQNTNSNFGILAYNRDQNYITPLTKKPTSIDMKAPVLTEPHAIELSRSQQTDQEIMGFSGSNNNILLEFDAFDNHTDIVYNPSRIPSTITSKFVKKYPDAQSTDPTATLHTYVRGQYYPETALNLGLTPLRNMYRNGAFLRSICDSLESKVIAYRQQYQMLFDNSSVPIPSISTNLDTGGTSPVFNEVGDIPISGLDAQLFRPHLLTLTTVSPVNMYETMNTNPYGYISFIWKGVLWKGFIWSVSQKISVSQPTTFELIAHPEVTNGMLING